LADGAMNPVNYVVSGAPLYEGAATLRKQDSGRATRQRSATLRPPPVAYS
jgi:hypothetical protein